MARADLLLNLVKAGTRGDHAQFQKTVEAMAADERAKIMMSWLIGFLLS